MKINVTIKERKKNCGCGKDPCRTFGVQKEEKEFKSHKMYDPNSEDIIDAESKEDHDKYAEKDYIHIDPKVIRNILRDEGGAAGINPFLDSDDIHADEDEIRGALEAMEDVGEHEDGDYILADDKEIIVKILKEEIKLLVLEQSKQKKKPDLNDIIDDLGLDPSPEEIKMLDRALQGSPEDLSKLPPELKGIVSQPADSGEVDDFLKSLDKSDSDKAEKEKAEKARQAAIRLLVNNPQEPVVLSAEDPSNIHDAIKKWDPFPGLLPQDTPPEAKKQRAQSLQNLMSKLKLIFEAQVRKSVEDVDRRFENYYGKEIFNHWVENGRKMHNHMIPFSIGHSQNRGSRPKGSMASSGKRVPGRDIKAGKLSFMQSYGLAPLILFGFRRNFSLVRSDRFGPKNIAATSRSPGASPALTAMVAYNYFQAVHPDMALQESLISNFNKESNKHFIGRAQRVGKDGSIPYRRGHFTTRSHNPGEWTRKNKWDKRPATATPITFEELNQTMADWRSNFKKFSSMEYMKPGMGYRESDEMLSVRHSQKISATFMDPRDPYKSPEEKKKVEKAKKKGEWGFGDQLKYYLRLVDKADEITGGAIKRNVYMGTEPSKGSAPFTGSQPKPGPPRIEESELINIINQEIQSVIGEKKKSKKKSKKKKSSRKKDACYNKVKSRYKVWPSAYASGALVKCRKVGAANWGNKSKKKK